MRNLNTYRKKQEILNKLAQELQQLEDDQAFKSELAFQDRLKDLMNEYGMSAADTADLVRYQLAH